MAEEDPDAAKMMEGFMKSASDMVSKAIENAGWIASFELIVALLSAFGAFLMFRLRKTGFWIYLVAKVLGILTILLFMGVNILTVSIASFALFVGLIMIVLYAVNLKHMH
jgi:TctA family transporter